MVKQLKSECCDAEVRHRYCARCGQECRVVADVLGMDQAWPLRDVLLKLAEASEHLSAIHNCDCHGWEAFQFVTPLAREYAHKLTTLAALTDGVAVTESQSSQATHEIKSSTACECIEKVKEMRNENQRNFEYWKSVASNPDSDFGVLKWAAWRGEDDRVIAALEALSVTTVEANELRFALEGMIAAFDDPQHEGNEVGRITRECAMSVAKQAVGWPVAPVESEEEPEDPTRDSGALWEEGISDGDFD